MIEITTGYDLIAPDVLPFEPGNTLSWLWRGKRICAADVLKIWGILMDTPVELKPIEIRSAAELATQNMIYAYDACFLECSLHWRYPLLTLDQKLKAIAISGNIEVLEI
ncbi:VapC toxin family PIN domain ribonuclease [Candidatus Fermentibacteria bacterium]|nr:MAG: VapC toxin family PIN domain ribonuclease [Candidatus Fermentibacteria bacterium]PIE53693.1 MAG: VapC toxin family PIN domain ribonuclease [Candidatus Fermentibacteria bacterium]